MLVKYLCLMLSFSLFFENSLAFAHVSQLQGKNYKEAIYKIFSRSLKIKDPTSKRLYLEKVLERIKQELEKADSKSFTEKEKESFERVKYHFKKWKNHLPSVADKHLDSFSRVIIQETEQAFFVCYILPVIIFVILTTVIIIAFHYAIKKLKKKQRRVICQRQGRMAGSICQQS